MQRWANVGPGKCPPSVLYSGSPWRARMVSGRIKNKNVSLVSNDKSQNTTLCILKLACSNVNNWYSETGPQSYFGCRGLFSAMYWCEFKSFTVCGCERFSFKEYHLRKLHKSAWISARYHRSLTASFVVIVRSLFVKHQCYKVHYTIKTTGAMTQE